MIRSTRQHRADTPLLLSPLFGSSRLSSGLSSRGWYIPCLCTRSTSDLLGTKSVHCVCVCCVAKGFSPCPGLRSLSLSHLETNHPSFFTTSGRLPLSRSLTALRSATSCCPRFPFFFVVVSSPARSLAEKCLAPIGAKRSKCTDRRKRQIR